LTNLKEPRTVPKGRLSRITRLAALGAQTGVSLLTSKDGSSAALKAAEVLGNLRGLAAKVGQMASYIDGAVPEAYRGAYEAALVSLRAATQSSPPEAIRRVVEQELGGKIEELFATWESDPFASASIGQVHRAKLADGRWVAVKVQHPGIEHAVESDLRNAGLIETMAGTVLPRAVDTKRVFNDIRARFREELDYERESENQRIFSRIHKGDAQVLIPQVVSDRSSRRVLTTELVSGAALEDAANFAEEQRISYASTLWRFEFKGLLLHGLFNADPHPGNFLFQSDNRIAFLDFGCVQPMDERLRVAANVLHAAAVRRNEADFYAAVTQMLGTRGGSYERAITAYVRRCFRPIFDSPFRITSDYVKEVVLGVRALKSEMFAKDKSFVMPPRGLAFMNRLQFGFYSVLSRLNVSVDYAQIEQDILAGDGQPRGTALVG
jgi:predicted unusual protein kinase regulating ubiquinone biosynthesis (AarF/ABC1/UbiB family)